MITGNRHQILHNGSVGIFTVQERRAGNVHGTFRRLKDTSGKGAYPLSMTERMLRERTNDAYRKLWREQAA